MNSFNRYLRRVLGRINGKKRGVFTLVIILFCVVAVSFGIYAEFYLQTTNGLSRKEMEKVEESVELKTNFSDLFTNELKTNEFVTAKRKNTNKDVVYTGYDLTNEDESYYSINAKIPTINIDNEKLDQINSEIRTEFYDKANSIMRQNKKYIVYNVSYVAFFYENVLSIVVKSSYKEGNSAERLSIKTYAINMNTNEMVSLQDLLNKKGISNKDAQKEINDTIKTASKNAKALSQEYEGVYQRDENNKMYNLENTNNYFYTNEGVLYIVYPYGNTEITNEMDIVIF